MPRHPPYALTSLTIKSFTAICTFPLAFFFLSNRMQLSKILGGGERARTDGLLRARQALSQLSYTPNNHGGPGRT